MSKNKLSFEASLSRHNHAVSAGYKFSLAPGMIIPSYFDVLGPGDAVYFGPKMFARMQDLTTAFLGEVDVHCDFFFVPMTMLFTPFGAMQSCTNDFVSDQFNTDEGSNNYPLMPLKDFCHQGLDLKQPDDYGMEARGKAITRLFDAFDLNPLGLMTLENYLATTGEVEETTHYYTDVFYEQFVESAKYISPWIPLAYQAIYQRYYRNDDLEQLKINSYNIDSFYSAILGTDDIYRMFKLRYVGRYDDYFTSTRVSPLSSLVNGYRNFSGEEQGGDSDYNLTMVNDYLGFGVSEYRVESKNDNNNNIYPESLSSNINPINDNFAFGDTSVGHARDWYPSAANIRALFAVDKFMRIYGRAGKTYDDQILAHFGYKVPHDVKHNLTHLKHYRLSLMSDPIYSTADVEGGSSLGQVGAQSNGSLDASNDKEKFVAPVHGVFMAVVYAKTKPCYFNTFSKLHQLCDRLQFPQPEFDKLGAQPLYGWEFSPWFMDASSMTEGDNPTYGYVYNVRVGWQNRYQQFKKKYNRLSLVFADPKLYVDNADEHASVPDYAPANIFAPYVLGQNAFNKDVVWNAYRQSAGNLAPIASALLPFELFLERPDSLNPVMAVDFLSSWDNVFFKNPASMFDTDPIFIDFFCDCNKVSWMSETGEPDL